MATLVVAAFVLWAVAVVCKAVVALTRGKDYVFAGWDGGALMKGRRLRGAGVVVKLVGTLVFIGFAVAWVLALLPFSVGKYGSIALVLSLLVADYAFANRPT
jgi:hypothetical protein